MVFISMIRGITFEFRKKWGKMKEKKRKKKSLQDRDNEWTMKKYEKRWKAESRVGDNMRKDKERYRKKMKIKKMLLKKIKVRFFEIRRSMWSSLLN